MFSGVVGSIWGARKREKRSTNPIWIPTRFCDDFGSILGIVLGAKIVQKSMWVLSVFSEGPQGGPSESFGGLSGYNPREGGVPGKGRIGVKPLSKGMWFVGLKKDGCRIEKGLWMIGHRLSKRPAQGPGLADFD